MPDVLDELHRAGLPTRSACGHTVRNVMCSEDAGVGLDEPFDCFADARMISDALVARSAELNVMLPSRINIALGGSPRCRDDALVNDIGLVSIVVDGRGRATRCGPAGAWARRRASACCSLRSCRDRTCSPPSRRSSTSSSRTATSTTPAKGRMKFVLERLGVDEFRRIFLANLDVALARPHPEVGRRSTFSMPTAAAPILAETPPGGWGVGVRPQRTAGLATVTVDLPLGDTNSSEFRLFCDLADRFADGHLTLTRDQNIAFRNVGLAWCRRHPRRARRAWI